MLLPSIPENKEPPGIGGPVLLQWAVICPVDPAPTWLRVYSCTLLLFTTGSLRVTQSSWFRGSFDELHLPGIYPVLPVTSSCAHAKGRSGIAQRDPNLNKYQEFTENWSNSLTNRHQKVALVRSSQFMFYINPFKAFKIIWCIQTDICQA